MGNLRDQFKKAKLISEKDARRLAHEERVHRGDVGREGVEQEQRARQEELERTRGDEAQRTRLRQEQLERERRNEAEHAACLELLEREARRPAPGGSAKWYFQLEDGRLPYLEVNEAERRQLGAGAFAIVRLGPDGAHVYGLLASAHARRLHRALPERIVWAPRGVLA